MSKITSFIKDFHLYKKRELIDAIASFSKKQTVVFFSILVVAIVSLIIILGKINSMFMIDVPVSGGTVTEGILGVPTLVNPVSALSDADKDLVALVYSGLMRESENGEFIPDLAELYTISPDGTVYTFTIKKDAKFQNGTKVTADDIIFTVEKINDPIIKSPRKTAWSGITVSKEDDYTVKFTLDQPYISFMENMTIGILPSKLWDNISSSDFNLSPLNTKAIGSGPYKIENVIRDKDGIPERYELKRFNRFTLGKPLIKEINIVSFSNEKDLIKSLNNGSIDQAGSISPEYIENLKDKGYNIHSTTLPRVFGIFFNSSKNKIFEDKIVIQAIDKTIDRQDLINQVLDGYGSIIYNPVPEKILKKEYDIAYSSNTIDEINEILDKDGWTLGEDGIRYKGGETTKTVTKKVKGKTVQQTAKSTEPITRLSFSITTGDTPELKEIESLIKDQLAKVGIEVDIQKVYEAGQLNQIIRARDYETLLFGQLINYESDLYSYWHSSQRTDPGLNIGMYNDKKIDLILETVQKTLSKEARDDLYSELIEEFDNNTPAILIYSPNYIYITSQKLNMPNLNITTPSDRFSSVYLWSTDTDKVWRMFTK